MKRDCWELGPFSELKQERVRVRQQEHWGYRKKVGAQSILGSLRIQGLGGQGMEDAAAGGSAGG